ncbi:acylamino-acid-releasing enzyme isoform 2-T3 [Pholidichthys leucotaenia]
MGDQQFLEIWHNHGIRKSLNLTALKMHGKVYNEAPFACLSWSSCENKLLYVAEKNRNETQAGDAPCIEDRNLYHEEWGEGLTNRSHSVLCMLDLESFTIRVLEGVPDTVSPGQALWAPSGDSLYFIGWLHKPYRLGLKFCSNRRSDLFRLDLKGYCERISEGNSSVSCPRLSPDGSVLIYQLGEVFGPHNQCLCLQQLELQSGKITTILDVVLRSQPTQFAGMYEPLPLHCWSEDGQKVVFSSARRNWKDLYMFDRRTKTITFLSNKPTDHSRVYGSWKLLTIQKDLMVVCCSSPSTPPTLRVEFLPAAGEAVTWQTLQQPTTFDFQWTIMDIQPELEEEDTCYSDLDFTAILVRPPHSLPETKIPLVIFIHGGPHSHFPAEWNSTAAGLAALGFAVLMVNYRGSIGFGQESILSLIGHIGNQDVKDVHKAVITALQRDLTLDSQRLAVMGGSHGGFVACHLIAQYPEFYKVCVARNPVINAATLLGTSDIVDWRYSSAGCNYSYTNIPSDMILDKLLKMSPIYHAFKIRNPVLLLLGAKDRRVSPHQGLELYKHLKSRNVQTRLLWYPEDGHSLSRVDTQADCFLNTVLWLQRHLVTHTE